MKQSYKQALKIIAILLLVLACGGALVVVSGLIPIRASSGHWAITSWFLNFTKDRSVATQSSGITVPELDDAALVARGAGHYEIGCRQCHGAPETGRSALVFGMTPKPPDLAEIVPHKGPAELYYVIKHGIKMTAMPAWPNLKREDEIWSVVAFLQKYPELSLAEYEQLVWGEHNKQSGQFIASAEGENLPVPHTVIEVCAGCHGLDGQGRGLGAFPRLAGQNAAYLEESLKAYRGGKRHSGTMQIVAGPLQDDEIQEVSRFYARLQPADPVERTEPGRNSADISPEEWNAAVERGAKIAAEGIPDQGVGACADCHPTTRQSFENSYPTLIGQTPDSLMRQLELFQQRKRGGTKTANLMHAIVDGLQPEQIQAVSFYYAQLSAQKSRKN